jgi:hypothetical protein
MTEIRYFEQIRKLNHLEGSILWNTLVSVNKTYEICIFGLETKLINKQINKHTNREVKIKCVNNEFD